MRSLNAVVDQYEVVLTSLEDMSKTTDGDASTKAAGLLEFFQKGTTLLVLRIAVKVFGLLEQLNRSFQCTSGTTRGMIHAVDSMASALQSLRTEEQFQEIFDVTDTVQTLDIDPVTLHITETVAQHFRQIFFAILYSACTQIYQKLNKNSPSLQTYLELGQMLLTGKMNAEVCAQYPELSDLGRWQFSWKCSGRPLKMKPLPYLKCSSFNKNGTRDACIVCPR